MFSCLFLFITVQLSVAVDGGSPLISGPTNEVPLSDVRTGAQQAFASAFADLKQPGMKVAVIANPTSVLQDLTHIVDAMVLEKSDSRVNVVAVLGPEHGFRGGAQAGHGGADHIDPRTGVRVLSAYGESGKALSTLINSTGANTLVFDIQDIGTRFYTYIWTLWDCLSAAAGWTSVTSFVVWDRPNPIGGIAVQGPVLDPAYSSFIGRLPIAQRHGMTVGELASLFYHKHLPAQARQQFELKIVPLKGWQRHMQFADTGLPWVMPSPNMPTPSTALVYPGTGIVEGTVLSEGRGTTRPFELIGAEFLTWEFADRMRSLPRPLPHASAAEYREAYFTPTFSKFAGNMTTGVRIFVRGNASDFDPIQMALELLITVKASLPSRSWADIWVDGTGANFDLHMGSNATRLALEQSLSAKAVAALWAESLQTWMHTDRLPYLLYG
eukprot:m.23184 g.23184  ORF g.23184 m.23184 type:complete len:440 (+) comp12919_c0_seq1:141-1460(+)